MSAPQQLAVTVQAAKDLTPLESGCLERLRTLLACVEAQHWKWGFLSRPQTRDAQVNSIASLRALLAALHGEKSRRKARIAALLSAKPVQATIMEGFPVRYAVSTVACQ
jgi:hypothetical protein